MLVAKRDPLGPQAGKVMVGEQDLPGARPAPKKEEKIRDGASRVHPWREQGAKQRRAARPELPFGSQDD